MLDRRATILLFRRIVGFLNHSPLALAKSLTYIKRELDNTLTKVRSPQYVYERVINFLVGRKHTHEAVLLYQRMLEEARLISSPALDAKRLALALAFPHGSPQRLMPLIAPIFSNPRYTDNDVWGLLKMMVKYRVDKDVIGTLVELFISTRRPNYIICPEFLAPQLSARVRTGDVDVAIELLGQFSSLDGLNQVAHASAHAPYVQVLAALQETRTWDSASVNRILDLMTKRGISLNLPMLNILLSREVRLGHHQSAIAIYSILKQMRKPKNISPDSFTFGSMFLLYRMMHPKSIISKTQLLPFLLGLYIVTLC